MDTSTKIVKIKVVRNLENNKDAKWFFSFNLGKRISQVVIYDELTKKASRDVYDSQGNGRWNVFFNQQIYVRF